MTYNDKKLLGEAYTLTQFNPSDKNFLVFKNVDGNTLKYPYPDLPVKIRIIQERKKNYKTYIPLYLKKVKEVVSKNTFSSFNLFIKLNLDHSELLRLPFNSPNADTEDFAKIEKIRNSILKLYIKNLPSDIKNKNNYPCVISLFGFKPTTPNSGFEEGSMFYLTSLNVYNKEDIKKKYHDLLNKFEKVMSKTSDPAMYKLMGHGYKINISLDATRKDAIRNSKEYYSVFDYSDIFKEEEEKLNDNIL